MKKLFLLLSIILLASCSQKVQNNTTVSSNTNLPASWSDIQATADVTTNVVDDNLSWQEDIQSIGDVKNSDSNLSLEQLEAKKLEKIANLKSGLYFYWLDCHKLFKLPQNIKTCEKRWLMEAATSCDDKEYFKWMNPDQIFNKKKFDLLSDQEIQQAKQQCLDLLKQEQEQQKQMEEYNKKMEELDKKMESFKISDCEKLAQTIPQPEVSPEEVKDMPEQEKEKILHPRQYFVKQCKIWFAIAKDNCNLIQDKKLKQDCEIINKYVKQYRLMRQYDAEYGNFMNHLREMLAQQIWLDLSGNIQGY